MPRVRVCSTLELPPFGGRLFEEAGGTERDVLIFKLPGGELAELQGTLEEQVSIEVSEQALRRFGLSFSDVPRPSASPR